MTLVAEPDGLLVETAHRYVEEQWSLADLRRLREGGPDAEARLRATWRTLGDLGWSGLLVAEEHGGAGAGYREMGVVAEALGSRLAVTPLVTTAAMAAVALDGSAAHAPLLAAVAAGESCVVPAFAESARTPVGCETVASPVAGGFRLRGAKQHVVMGPIADALIVCARHSEPGAGCVLAVVDPAAPGVTTTPGVLIDGQPVASVRLDGAEVPAEALIAPVDRGRDVLARTVRAGTAIRAAWCMGALDRAVAITVAYLREREQFGVPIGAFQALQHRAARLHCEAQLAGAMVSRSLEALDAEDGRAARFVHAAAARLVDGYVRAAEEGVQMHGGFGMTDDAEIGFHLKAAYVAAMDLGDAAYHRSRYAAEAGF